MTLRKAIFTAVKQRLKTIQALELVDYNRNQFAGERVPNAFTAGLIKIMPLQVEAMTNHQVEGDITIQVSLFTKDGWLNQYAANDFIEIDLIDEVIEALHMIELSHFDKLKLVREDEIQNTGKAAWGYILEFQTKTLRSFNYPYSNKTISIQ